MKKLDFENLLKRNGKRKHISHDTFSGETFVDNFNIDFIRYFRVKSFLVAFIYSAIGAALFFGSDSIYTFFWQKSLGGIVAVFLLMVAFILAFLTSISFFATDSLKKALRMSGRRGFYNSFTIILAFSIVLASSGNFSWGQQFYVLVKNFFSAVILMALISLPADWLITFVTDVMSEKAEKGQKSKKEKVPEKKPGP